MTKLKVVKLTPKQNTLMAELVVYFNGRRLHALGKMKDNPMWVEPIPLKKIYNAHKCNSRGKEVVKVAAAIFFKQVSRGNNVTGKCSTWSALGTPHINAQVKKMIEELYEENKDHTENIRTFYNTSKDDPTVVEVTTTFKFKNKAQAAAFAELMQQIEIDEETEENE